MRVGAVLRSGFFNAFYRAIGPANAMRARGHEMELVEQDVNGTIDMARLRTCDVVHVYRCAGAPVLRCVDELHRCGIGVTWDNDDDIRLLPPESPLYARYGGLAGKQDFKNQVQMMRRVDVVTTPSAKLAETYRAAGAHDVRQIENYLIPEQYSSAPRRHEGLVIGWVAALEHRADARALDLAKVLQRVMERHPEVRVETIGVRLDLDPARYTHVEGVQFMDLKDRLRQFDIGIAPLSDIPMNHARSNVKVKEYAAAGVPWLASARGPYEGLGPKEGGWLVADDDWGDALETLVRSRVKRAALRRRAAAWAKTQAMARHADLWLDAFETAVARAGAGRRQPATAAR